MMNKLLRVCLTSAFFAALCLIPAEGIFSASAVETGKTPVKNTVKASVKTGEKVPVKTSVKTEEKSPEIITETHVDNIYDPGFHTNRGNMVTIGGGYLMPRGEMASYLKPAWSVKLTFQDNRKGGTPIGIGADLIYSYPHDKEVNGGLMIITAAPHISLTIPFFKVIDLQFKAGPGITVLTSILDSGKNVSGDMTLHAGGNVSRIFAGSFYIGLGADYYYIFERKNLKTVNSWFSMGYRW